MGSMQLEHVTLERDGDVAIITLANVERRNAFSRPMQQSLRQVLAEVPRMPGVRAVLLTGAGEQAFCAGADLAGGIPDEASGMTRGEATRQVMVELSNPIILDLRSLPLPVVVAVNGVAAGAGVGLALAGDIVIASRNAYFYLPFIPKLGIVPDLGTTWFMEHFAGRSRAVALTLLGDKLSAETAQQWGLIWACVDAAELRTQALAIARRLAKLPGHAALETRDAYEAAGRNDLAKQLQYEADRQCELLDRPEFEEGVRAFLEKREPDFSVAAAPTE
jgi:2-(1,2-epoxy-1,2-dihydrophenyl)acetyl-CoA isomerase